MVDLTRKGSRVSATVDVAYLRRRFDEPGEGFVVELLDDPEIEYRPYDEPTIADLSQISTRKPSIATAEHEADHVVVWGGGGSLKLRYRRLALRFNTGAPLALKALDECARSYWHDWGRTHGR